MPECQRCGLCCQDCGDLAGDVLRDSGVCSALFFEGDKAVCRIQQEWGYEDKPGVCRNYPYPDIDGGKCKRQLKEEKEK